MNHFRYFFRNLSFPLKINAQSLCSKNDASKLSNENLKEISIDDLNIKYIKSSGPGGQSVNKTNSKVEIRFHVPSVKWIPEEIKQSFMKMESSRMNKDNYFIIYSDKTKLQIHNQVDCLNRIKYAIKKCIDANCLSEPDEETKDLWEKRLIKFNDNRLKMKKEQSNIKSSRRSPTNADL